MVLGSGEGRVCWGGVLCGQILEMTEQGKVQQNLLHKWEREGNISSFCGGYQWISSGRGQCALLETDSLSHSSAIA